MTTNTNLIEPITKVTDLCRTLMLLRPNAALFDGLPMQNSLERVHTVARALVSASGFDIDTKERVLNSGAIPALKEYAKLIHAGELLFPAGAGALANAQTQWVAQRQMQEQG
jgi:hypothetical protein